MECVRGYAKELICAAGATKNYIKFLSDNPVNSMFRYNHKIYKCCRSIRRCSYTTERMVEIPIIINELQKDMKILEVGNVLHGHCNFKRDIVDKYEIAKGVINCDIIDYRPVEKYDVVVSISTLEHVGFDEVDKDPDKAILAIKMIRSFLKPNGKVFVTVPLGYNKSLDQRIADGRIPYKSIRVLVRMGRVDWAQTPYCPTKDYVFGSPYPYGNYVAVMEFDSL